jgi:hypothetical protein
MMMMIFEFISHFTWNVGQGWKSSTYIIILLESIILMSARALNADYFDIWRLRSSATRRRYRLLNLSLNLNHMFGDIDLYSIVARKPVPGQRSREKKIYKSRCWVTASQTNIYPRQRLNYKNEKRCFLRRPCQGGINVTSLEFSQLWDIRQPVRTLAEDNVRIRYQETTSENIEDFICAAVTVIFRVFKPVRLI